MKADFFITYHHNDELAARWIAGVLKEVPFSILMESWDFLPGNQPLEKIEHMNASSRSVLGLLSGRFIQEVGDAVSWHKVTEIFSGGGTKAVMLLRIDSCEVEKVLGDMKYTNLFGMKEAEARKRLLTAVGAPAVDKKEPVPLQVTAMTREEVLEKRKAELDELLNTTIKNQYHMKLDLEQEIEKEVEVKDEKTGKIIEKRKQWVWEAVELETVLIDKNNYILVNPSGMGKTTFLNYAACVFLDRDGDYPFVPLFTTCITLNNREGSIANFIQQRVESFFNNSQTAIVQGEWENLCILLDALDQARDVDDIVSSLQIHDKYHYYKKAKILLSSRQNTADKVKAGFKKIRLKLPEDDEVRHYLGEENYNKLENHIAASRELVTVPVLLEMLKTITEKGYKASKLWNRADLYTEFTRILIDQERSKPRFWQDSLSIRHFIDNELEQVLEKIAFFSLADNKILEIEKDKLVQYCESLEKKETLLNIGIILELFEDREQKIVFRHQSFQAYFAARYIYNQQPEIFSELIGDTAFFYNDVWYEVMRFFVGLEKDPQKAGNIIDAIYQTKDKKVNLNQALRLIFAFFLMSDLRVSTKFVQRVYKQFGDLLTNNKQYLDFFISNTDKFNKSNEEQWKFIIIIFNSLLSVEDGHVRSAAAEVFGKICTANDIHFLKPLLRDKDEYVRFDAIEALVKIGAKEHIPLLKPLLRDEKKNVRLNAAKAYGKIGTSKDIPLLKPLLWDEDWDVSVAAAEALGNIGTTKDIPLLETLLGIEDSNVRYLAVKALGNIVTAEDIPLLELILGDTDRDIRIAVVYALVRIGTAKVIPLLKSLLYDSDKYVRRTAKYVFEETVTEKKDIPFLEILLRDKDEDFWSVPSEALVNIVRSKDIPLLENLLRDKSDCARRTAAEALGKIGTSEHIPLLESLLRDKNYWVRQAALRALGKIGTSQDIPLIEPLLRNKDWDVRRDAVEAVGNIGASKDIPLLEPLLRDENEHVRGAAAKALGKIGTTEHIHLLEFLLRDVDKDVRNAATEALGKIGISEHIPLLEPLLRDEDHWVRRDAAKALGKIGTSEHIPLLEPLFRDEDDCVCCIAAEALEKIGTSEHTPLLARQLRDKNDLVRRTAAKALGYIFKDEYIPFIEPLLRDNDWNVRLAAAEMLGEIVSGKGIPLLEPLLRDEDLEVRKAAIESIEKIYKHSIPKLRIDSVLPVKKKKKVLAVKPFFPQSLHILHISDIHYALEKDPTITCIFHEFLQDIQKWRAQQNNQKIHSICLTGDIAQTGQKNQYESINEKINAILNTTGCSKEHLFIIPGNHDFREYHKISDKGKTTLEEVRENKMNIDTGVLSRFENYREFHEKFNHYYDFVESSGFVNSLPLTDKRSDIPKPWYSRKLQDFPVRIIGLNSALFCLKEFSEYGKIRMGANQFHEAYFQGKPGNIPNGELVILLTHHPINWLTETEYEAYSTLMERYSVIHLHGHIHRTKIRKLFSIAGSSYISVGTGSLYGEKGLGDINTYHIITLDFKKEEVHIWARRWIPERGCWGVYDNDINNTFPFPGKHH